MSTNAELQEIADAVIEAGLADADTAELQNQLGQRLRQELLENGMEAPPWAQGNYGAVDTAKRFIESQYTAIHNEVCDCDVKGLRAEYEELLSPSYPKAVAIAGVGMGVLKAFQISIPELAIPSIAVYTALILIRANLRQWCSEGCS